MFECDGDILPRTVQIPDHQRGPDPWRTSACGPRNPFLTVADAAD